MTPTGKMSEAGEYCPEYASWAMYMSVPNTCEECFRGSCRRRHRHPYHRRPSPSLPWPWSSWSPTSSAGSCRLQPVLDVSFFLLGVRDTHVHPDTHPEHI